MFCFIISFYSKLSLGFRTCFTQGGINKFDDVQNPTPIERSILGYRIRYYGWMGFGGSVMQWHPQLKIGFGYTPTLLQWYDVHNKKGAKLQKLAVECARKILQQ